MLYGKMARSFIKKIKKKPENYYLIHYSCQSLYDDNEGLSPRITSIAVQHYKSGQVISFSTHAVAEELGIDRDQVERRFDEIELRLLENFFNFVRDRRDKYWIHWNMRNLTYGFEHINHRYNVLKDNNFPIIPVEQRINLSDVLKSRYGSGYAKHPKLLSLMDLNGGRHRHFLTGEEEVQAFQAKEFIRMHNSTLCKVRFFSSVIEKVINGRLRTSTIGFGVMLDRVFESRLAKLIGLISAIGSLLILVLEAISWT